MLNQNEPVHWQMSTATWWCSSSTSTARFDTSRIDLYLSYQQLAVASIDQNCLATHLHPDPLIKPKCLFNAQDAFIHLIREMMRHSFALGVMNSTLAGLFKQVLLQFIRVFARGACMPHRDMQNSQWLITRNVTHQVWTNDWRLFP